MGITLTKLSIVRAILIGFLITGNVLAQLPSTTDLPLPPNDPLQRNTENLTLQEQQAANFISQQVAASEWLGTLAPVAISPFFGLTCLSGVAILGEDYLPEGNFLRRDGSPLRQPVIFLVFLALTVLTSVPKFSKVSKPFAQACDQLEAYAALVVLLIIRVLGNLDSGAPMETQEVVLRAGMIEFSAESLLMLATFINVIVINTVKFGCEVIIWITPLPLIDAMFEVGSKLACATLTGIYVWSPTVATILNLTLLAACLVAFGWIRLRVRYYRIVLFHFLCHYAGYQKEPPQDAPLVVFPLSPIGAIPKLAKCELTAVENGWHLAMPRILRSTIRQEIPLSPAVVAKSLLFDHVTLADTQFNFAKQDLGTRAAALRFQIDRTSETHPAPTA